VLLSSSVLLVHCLTAHTHRICDRDPRILARASAAHLLGLGTGELGVERAQSAQLGEGLTPFGRGDGRPDLVAHAVNRS
jgi:hypothetical protein